MLKKALKGNERSEGLISSPLFRDIYKPLYGIIILFRRYVL